MKLFGRKKDPVRVSTDYPLSLYEPVIRCSICTGEQVACMRERETGHLVELMLIQSPADLALFCKRYGVSGEIRKIY